MKMKLLAALLLLAAAPAHAQSFPPLPPLRVQNAGTSVATRFKLNFASGATCVDNATTGATDCTIAGGGAVTVNSPLGGDGSSGSHLTCTTCITGSPSATGDILYSTSGTVAMTPLADVSAGSYLLSGGVAAAPAWSTLKLPNAATVGDILYASATNSIARLASDSHTTYVLHSGGTATAPAYSAIAEGDLPIDETTLAPKASPTFTGLVTAPRYACNAGPPTIAPGAGLGSGGSVGASMQNNPNDCGGVIRLVVGSTSPLGSNATEATITWAVAKSQTAHMVMFCGNANCDALTANGGNLVWYDWANSNTTTAVLKGGTGALGANLTYEWNYLVLE